LFWYEILFIFHLVFDFVELLFIFCFVLNSFVAYVYDGILGVRRCLDFVSILFRLFLLRVVCGVVIWGGMWCGDMGWHVVR